MILFRNMLISSLGLAGLILCGCQPLTEAGEGQADRQKTFASEGETISHGYHSEITPENIEPDNSWRTYPMIQADWNGPGGDSRWLGMNLGAVEEPVAVNDDRPESAGWYFKFNREQGYYYGGPGNDPVEHFPPEPTNDYPVEEFNSDWLKDDPCTELLGSEWRIPTEAEWLAAGEADADLNLHKGGFINGIIGYIFDYRGTRGNYWSSDQHLLQGRPVYQGKYIAINDDGRVGKSDNILMSMGMPVRCIEDREI